jgi:hypothetical protein
MGMPALGIGDVVDRDCKMYPVLNDMSLTRPDPRHPFRGHKRPMEYSKISARSGGRLCGQ